MRNLGEQDERSKIIGIRHDAIDMKTLFCIVIW
mgnify:CR=1 FL=1